MGSTRKNPVVTLQAELKKFNYRELQAQSGMGNAVNINANSGVQTYKDIPRTDFVINGKSITRDLIDKLYEQYNYLLHNNKEKFFECANTEEELAKLQNDEDEEFFECISTEEELAKLQQKDEELKGYRDVVKEVFKGMFKYVEAHVPNDFLLEELVTNCNQAGYEGALYGKDQPMYQLSYIYELIPSSSGTMYINTIDSDNIVVQSNAKIAIRNSGGKSICQLDSSIKFTLESENNNSVICKNGKLSLAIPKELKNYKVDGKNLFDVIREYFQKFCEKLGFEFGNKIEVDFGELSVNGHLDSVEKPINCINNSRKAAALG